jgi:Asp/Glu/hydantoin racemase
MLWAGRHNAGGERDNVAQTLALIHTSPTLTPLFSTLCTEFMPATAVFHMVDESLIKDTIREGRLRRVTMRRLLSMIESAQTSGADAVLVTCSSIGPGVALGQRLFDIPVIRVDEAMAEAAVRMGRRIGVMATLQTTLEPTIALLREKADEARIEIEIVESLCDGAFDAVLAGDAITHDRILSHALEHEMKGVDVVILAQASMARVVKTMPEGTLTMPVLSSPELAVMQTRDVMARLNGGAPELVGSNGRQANR